MNLLADTQGAYYVNCNHKTSLNLFHLWEKHEYCCRAAKNIRLTLAVHAYQYTRVERNRSVFSKSTGCQVWTALVLENCPRILTTTNTLPWTMHTLSNPWPLLGAPPKM